MSTRLSSADAAWLHMDRPTNLMVINSVLLFDEPVDWQRVKEVYRRAADRPLPPVSPARRSRAACRFAHPAGRTIPTSRSSTTCTIWRCRRPATRARCRNWSAS